MEVKLELKDCTVRYEDTPEVRDAVFERVMAYFKKHQAFSGDSIHQMDDPIIDAPSVMSDIAENIIKFKEEWN